ncbi:MAG: hypothetical protein HGA78_09635 [Nitrospirales bacterium]|nr:hypothetical protein [Nitrospirales bacterium]
MIPLLIALHVVGVVIWVGGVSFVTTTVFPMIMRLEGSLEKVLFFQGVEHRFARIAKAMVALVGITGVLLLQLTGEWSMLFTKAGIGPTLMLIVWLFYVFILLFEARIFKAVFGTGGQHDTEKVFFHLTVFHWVILGLSLLAVGVGVWAGHGGIVP